METLRSAVPEDTESSGPLFPVPILQPDVGGHLAAAEERLYDKLVPVAIRYLRESERRSLKTFAKNSNSLARLKAIVRNILRARRKVICLRNVINTILGPRMRDAESQLQDLATAKKLRREKVKRFFESYRPVQVSREVPVGQVMEDMTTKPLLDTQCRFWQVADTAAGRGVEQNIATNSELAADRSKQSWIVRAAKERKCQRWGLGEKLRQGHDDLNNGKWDIRSSTNLKHFRPTTASKCVKTVKPSMQIGLGKSTSLPSLHSKHGGFGKPEHCGRDANAMSTTFTETWKSETAAKQKAVESMSRYMTACERGHIVPTPLDFITSGSKKLDAANWALSDSDLIPVATMFRAVQEVHEVDLSANTLLTDKSLVPLLKKMRRNPACSTLTRLNFRQCFRLGPSAIEEIIHLVSSSEGLTNLKVLDISGIPFPVRLQQDFFVALGEHSRVESLMLADIGLGSNPGAKKCLETLFKCDTLVDLDLSWNSFGDEVFGIIGAYVSQPHVHLKSLSVSNCSSANIDTNDLDRQGSQAKAFKALNLMLECLCKAKRLTYLDISINRLDLTAALILEDVLCQHPNLTELDVSRNPFGALGAHSMMRLFGISKIERLHCTESFDVGDLRGQPFQLSNPEGAYSLNLSLPFHRSILRMLLKYCKILSLSVKQAFTEFSSSFRSLPSFSEDEDGMFEVPRSGHMSFVFSSTKAMSPDVYQDWSRKDCWIGNLPPSIIFLLELAYDQKSKIDFY